jgi:hypothetical protein
MRPSRAPEGFGATEYAAEPDPEPVVPLIEIQPSLVSTVHPHPALVVIVTAKLPPEAGTRWEDGVMACVHPVSNVGAVGVSLVVPVHPKP